MEEFLELYWRDRDQGVVGPVEEYLELFPEAQEGIRRELESLAAGVPEGPTLALPKPVDPGENGHPPRLIGSYRILKELGRGGQGAVYLAEDLKLPRKVALKVLLRSDLASPEALLRFQREAEVLSRLDHPSICPVLDAGVDRSMPYIAMKFLEGRTLGAALWELRNSGTGSAATESFLDHFTSVDTPIGDDSASPAPRQAGLMNVLRIVEDVARALDAAHEAGVIHRDVKPGNIMLAKDGRAVIMDLGLAHADETAGGDLTSPSQVLGTPAYMSPEQLAPQSLPVDHRTDVWSLGVTLYECVTHRRPFEGQTREALARAILTDEPTDPRKLNPHIPRDLAVVITTALEKNPVRRFHTAAAFADELRRVRLRQPIHARPVGPVGRLSRWFARNPLVAASTTALFVVMISALVLTLMLLDRATTAGNDARASADTALANLRMYEQLSDAKRVTDLLREADEDLWPRWSDKIPEMDRWLMETTDALSRSADHRRALEGLKTRARPLTPEDLRHEVELRRKRHPDLFVKRQRLLEERNEIVQSIGESSVEAIRADLRRQLETVEADLREIDTSSHMTRRLCWHFDSAEVGWRFQVLDRLLEDLERLRHKSKDVRNRRTYAADIRGRSIEDERAAWDRCVRSIRESATYENRQTVPQIELVPLREDPESHLWEFWHVGSGERPEVDSHSGRLVMKPETGLVLVLLPGGVFHCGAQAQDPQEPCPFGKRA